jgi:CrcB protein
VRELVALGVAGALGTVSRYALGGVAHRLFGAALPYGTLAVNVLGCFLLGLVVRVGMISDLISPGVRTVVAIGFLGAFTTFSTFGYETFRYMEDGAWRLALTNVFANLVLGLAAVWLGFVLANVWMGGA